MLQNKKKLGHIIAIITVIIWGTTFISTKVLLQEFTPIEVMLFRFIIAFVMLNIMKPQRLRLNDKRQEWYFVGAGLCGVTLYFLMENIALTYTNASNVGVIISIAPFFTGLFAWIFFKGKSLKKEFFIGFLIAIIGITIISFNGQSEFHLNPTGDILTVMAAVVWAVYSNLVKKISGFGYHTVQVTRRIFFYGILGMIPALFVLPFRLEFSRLLNPVYLINILYLGVGASAICFVTWNLAVKWIGVVKTSAYIYASPVITVITSIIVLQEKITGIMVLGTMLTLLGLFVSETKVIEHLEKGVLNFRGSIEKTL
ncbi:MAG: DMT family transporter [Lachnospiraceae bacterium]|nr:DMT family transporter [Lachnospiraceae bacterium]